MSLIDWRSLRVSIRDNQVNAFRVFAMPGFGRITPVASVAPRTGGGIEIADPISRVGRRERHEGR